MLETKTIHEKVDLEGLETEKRLLYFKDDKNASHTSHKQTQAQTQAQAQDTRDTGVNDAHDVDADACNTPPPPETKVKEVPLDYGTIYYKARKELGISVFEYLVCELIYKRHTYQHNKSGWCKDNKESIANTLGLSKPWVIEIIKRLIKLKLLEKNETGRLLRTTPLWQDTRKRHASKKKDKSEEEKREQSDKNFPDNESVNNVDKTNGEMVNKVNQNGKQSLQKEMVNRVNQTNGEMVNRVNQNGKQSLPKGETKIGEHTPINGESASNTAFSHGPSSQGTPDNNYKNKKKKEEISPSSQSRSDEMNKHGFNNCGYTQDTVLAHLGKVWNKYMPQLGFLSAPPALTLPKGSKDKLKAWISENKGNPDAVIQELNDVLIPYLQYARSAGEWPVRNPEAIPRVGVLYAINSPQLRQTALAWKQSKEIRAQNKNPLSKKTIDFIDNLLSTRIDEIRTIVKSVETLLHEIDPDELIVHRDVHVDSLDDMALSQHVVAQGIAEEFAYIKSYYRWSNDDWYSPAVIRNCKSLLEERCRNLKGKHLSDASRIKLSDFLENLGKNIRGCGTR